MHDEDSAIGLSVTNPIGDTWMMFGDGYLLDKANDQNLKKSFAAVQKSADEVYQAWKEKKVLKKADYGALKILPTLESAQKNQVLAPLFRITGDHPVTLKVREDYVYTSPVDFSKVAAVCDESGLFRYPNITLRPREGE